MGLEGGGAARPDLGEGHVSRGGVAQADSAGIWLKLVRMTLQLKVEACREEGPGA